MKPQQQTLWETAGQQDGQFPTRQARKLGITRHQLATMRTRGEVTQQRQGVWRFNSAPGVADPAVTAMLTCWPDAVISHRSAARYHGLTRFKPFKEPEITVTHGEVRRLPGIRVHWTRDLPDDDVLIIGRIRYTSVARTVCDLADPKEPWDTLALLDDAIAGGAKRTWIHSRAAALTNGRSGVRLIRDATSSKGSAEFRSWLERSAAHVYRAGGLPDPQWNMRLYDGRGFLGTVDAVWPRWRVVSEKEGLRFHTTPRQRRADAERFNRLLDADYRPRRFTWEDIVHRPVEVVETLFRALRSAGADLDPVRIPRTIVLPAQPFL